LLALLDLCLCSLNQQGYPCWGIDFSLSNVTAEEKRSLEVE